MSTAPAPASPPLSRNERKRRHRAAQQSAASSSVSVASSSAAPPPPKKPLRMPASAFLPLTSPDVAPVVRRCVLEYDGARFQGFQAQSGRGAARTVQEEVEDALRRTTGETLRLRAASRTDAGVHAPSSPTLTVNPIKPTAPHQNDVVAAGTGVHILLYKRAFRLCWLVIMLLHFALAVFPAAIGVLYRYLTTTNFMDSITGYSLAVGRVYFEPIARVYFFISSIHAAMFLLYLVRSIRCMEPTFRPPLINTDASGASGGATALPESTGGRCMLLRTVIAFKLALEQGLVQAAKLVGRVLLRAVLLCLPPIAVRCFHGLFDAATAVFAAMDIQSENYDVFFVVREIAQTFLQTFQAYRMSVVVPRLWMNNVSVGFIVLNCWSTPLIRFFFSKAATPGATRLSCALVSLILDVVSYALIPLVMYYPYHQQFDRLMKTFDRRYGYTDIWLIQTINELRLLLVVSLYDAFSKFMIAISIPRWLHAITKLLHPRETHRRRVSIASGNRFLTLWGLFVLVVHGHAATHPFHPQCRLRTRSWFASKPGCSLLEVNCVEEKLDGAAQDLTEIIEHAAVTATRHPMLRFMFFLDVNMTALPPGLLSPDFPQKLSQVVISRSNLTELPDTLHKIWPKRLVLILEELQVRSFPAVVTLLAPLYLSLALNNLTEIPVSFLNNAIVPLLVLSGNPFRSLPSQLPGPRPPIVGWVSLISTDIEELPDWITSRGSYIKYPYITAAHTPLCNRMIASGEAAASLVLTDRGSWHGIDCFTVTSPGRGNWYPLAWESEWNPSYTLH
ncbi:hypothetical protein PybrP1_003016 [[Pythium] brassicae (nom. inval.)]|nr:hypothetical protein PybrP1_003016 [[Pythium] brassicae (nom. inval.)]